MWLITKDIKDVGIQTLAQSNVNLQTVITWLADCITHSRTKVTELAVLKNNYKFDNYGAMQEKFYAELNIGCFSSHLVSNVRYMYHPSTYIWNEKVIHCITQLIIYIVISADIWTDGMKGQSNYQAELYMYLNRDCFQ